MIQIFKLPNLNPSSLKGKKALVLGAGYSGLAISKYLDNFGCKLLVADSRENPPNSKEFFQIETAIEKVDFDSPSDSFVNSFLSNIDFIAISPGIPLDNQLIKIANNRLIPLVSEIEIFGQALLELDPNSKIVGISGSNGKTTVTSMLGMLLSKTGVDCEVVGNIKPAVLERLLARIKSNSKLPLIWVVELSSFQLATTYRTKFSLGVVLNFSNNHLDWHPNLDDYFNSKQKLYTLSKSCIINLDDQKCQQMAKHLSHKIIATFALNSLADFTINNQTQEIIVSGKTIGSRLQSPLIGKHNSSNILAAIALYQNLGFSINNAVDYLSEFKGLAHRTELVATIDGVDFINDSKSTTVASTIAAILGLSENERKIILIAGGISKNQDFSELSEVIDKKLKKLILFGIDAKKIESDIIEKRPKNFENNLEVNSQFKSALNRALNISDTGDIILFSPACASYDMFTNYEERGEAFKNWVRNFQKENFELIKSD